MHGENQATSTPIPELTALERTAALCNESPLAHPSLKHHNTVMATVTFQSAAARQFQALPERIKDRLVRVIARLERWPEVSGAKPLRGDLAGHYRIRSGDYRLQFHVQGDEVVIERVGHRDGFYE
jgi:mRNA-degrading endonuclease RelE of RelBE toxin-antitoxin system